MTGGNRRRGVNLGPRDPSLSYTNTVRNCAKELAGGSYIDGQNRGKKRICVEIE